MTIWLKVSNLFLQCTNVTIMCDFTSNILFACKIGCVYALVQV